MSVIKLRGLPWSVTKNDVIKFLNGIDVKENYIHLLTNKEGKPRGEAFVELETDEDVENALKLNNALMGQRYIEIFHSNAEQMNKCLEESDVFLNNWNDPVVRLRGLPFGCTERDVETFFEGIQIESILMVIDFSGRFNGEAFAQLNNMDQAYRALEKHKQLMGHRYIEIFRSSFNEMNYYATNSNLMKIKKMFNEFSGLAYAASNGNQLGSNGSGGSVTPNTGSTSSNMNRKMVSNNSSNYRSTPYQKPNQRHFNNNNNNNSNQNRNYNQNYNNNTNNTNSHHDYTSDSNNVDYKLNQNDYTTNNSNDAGNQNDSSYEANRNNYAGMMMSLFNQQPLVNFNNSNNNNNSPPPTQRTNHCIKMRGLPYTATKNDVNMFFAPLAPANVTLLYASHNGRFSGEAEVDFHTHNDACEAMKYDKKYIGNRYIELFLQSTNVSSSNNSSFNSSNNSNAANNSYNEYYNNTNRPVRPFKQGGRRY